jgi:hypothetical protein
MSASVTILNVSYDYELMQCSLRYEKKRCKYASSVAQCYCGKFVKCLHFLIYLPFPIPSHRPIIRHVSIVEYRSKKLSLNPRIYYSIIHSIVTSFIYIRQDVIHSFFMNTNKQHYIQYVLPAPVSCTINLLNSEMYFTAAN